tara:strand:- start:2042 stop:2266 length:225 start_codon:yes stop_codon:yes gene_type:complete
MSDFAGIFEENVGQLSWTRVMMTVVIGVALFIALAETIFSMIQPDFDIHETLILTMIGIGTGGKVTQKAFEKKS